MPSSKPQQTLRHWLAADDYGLTMSSGFFGFFAHAGMLSVLEDENLLPSRFSGSSAGALISALWSAGLNSPEIRDGLFELDKAAFWDPAFGPGLLRGQKFRDLLTELLPVHRFADCRRPLALSAYALVSRRTQVINDGALVPAVYASCCVPFLFQPLRINSHAMVDGGIADRPGLAGMQSERVLYHHLASRSPWRRKNGAQSRIPQRSGMTSLVIHNLPRVGPNKLAAGRNAYTQARSAMQTALDQPLKGTTLELTAS